MTGFALAVAMSLTILALLAFAVSLVAFLIQTSRHRPYRRWTMTAGASLVLILVFGAFSNVVSRQSRLTLAGEQASVPSTVGQADHDARVTVTRVVDGDTIDTSPSVNGLSRVSLIGMDTPEVYFGAQPYGPEASAFAKRELEGEEVGLEFDVQKVDPYHRSLAIAGRDH